MNIREIFFFVLLVFSKDIQKTSLVKTEDIELDNLFHDNTKSLHIAMNKLFTVLKLNKAFKQAPKIQLLLNMHNNFINIVENNHKDNEEIENITDNIPLRDWFNMSRIVRRISFKKLLRKYSAYRNETKYNISEDKITDVIIEYIKEFLVKIDILKFYVDEFASPCTAKNSTVSPPMKKFRNSGPNLKVWVPDDNVTNVNSNRRMFDSKKTKVSQYPFMVSVHVMSDFVCAGTVISKDLVITAASCLQAVYNNKENGNYLPLIIVRAASDFPSYGGQLVPIINVYFHPNYDPRTLRNNLAILRMDNHKPFEKGNKIRRVQLDKTGELLYTRKDIMMLGWGARDVLNTPDEYQKLSYAILDSYDQNACEEVYSNLYVTDNHFCGGFVNKPSGACSRDVGDPAIVSGILVGVVSFGPPMCGTPGAPTVFTKISSYVPWIDSIADLDADRPKKSLRAGDVTLNSGQVEVTPILPTNTSDNKHDYPEEVFILKDMLNNLALSNDTILEELIDEGFHKEIAEALTSTPQMEEEKQPLEDIYETVKLTTPFSTTQDQPHKNNDEYFDYDEFAYMFKVLQNNMANISMRIINEAIATTTPLYSPPIGRIPPNVSKLSLDFDSSQSYYDEGLSIEFTTAKVLEKPIHYFFDEGIAINVNFDSKKQEHETTSILNSKPYYEDTLSRSRVGDVPTFKNKYIQYLKPTLSKRHSKSYNFEERYTMPVNYQSKSLYNFDEVLYNNKFDKSTKRGKRKSRKETYPTNRKTTKGLLVASNEYYKLKNLDDDEYPGRQKDYIDTNNNENKKWFRAKKHEHINLKPIFGIT